MNTHDDEWAQTGSNFEYISDEIQYDKVEGEPEVIPVAALVMID